ncbi:MAG: ABC transporter permease subunit [Candidatus Delongbacteria bacterium]
MTGLYLLTIKELLSKKIILTVFIIATLFAVLLMFALNIKIGGMDSKFIISVFGNQLDAQGTTQDNNFTPEKLMSYIHSGIAVAVFFVSLFISLFSVSSVFPDMLKKGNIDLIISKPVSRSKIFFQRFSGALTAVSLNVFYLILASWTILSLKFGIWDVYLPLSGFIIMIFFFNIYSLMTMISMFIKNNVISLMLTYFLVFILSPVVAGVIRYGEYGSTAFGYLIRSFYRMLPKVSETVVYITDLITGGQLNHSVLFASIVSGSVFVGISLLFFKRSDY